MSIQSLMTPAMFMVSADVLPMRRKTAKLRVKAMRALLRSTGTEKTGGLAINDRTSTDTGK